MKGAEQITENESPISETEEQSNKWILLVVVILMALLLIGESIFTVFKYRGLRHITTSDGLVAEWISTIVNGPNGEIWVGGPGGIFRIDGPTVTPLPLAADMATQEGYLTLAVAPNQDIWVSYFNQDFGFRGLYHFNSRKWLQYPEMFDLPGRITLLGVAPNGETWFSYKDGLISYDGHDWQQNALADGPVMGHVNGIRFPITGGIWVTTLDPDGLVYFDGDEFEQIYDGAQVGYGTTFDIDEDGAVWVGNYDGGVSHYDGEDWTDYTTEDGLLDDWINGISIGPDGIIWAATEKGISCFNGNNWQALVPLADGFEVQELLVDDQNNLWFTIDQHGFLPIDSTGIRVYDKRRMVLPVEAIKAWRITRIALISAIISLLFVAGQRKSHIPAKDRLQTSLRFSLITSGIIFLILIVVLIILSNDCGGGGVILGIPGFALVIILSVALGVLVGYLQRDGLRLTQAATIISAVILGGLCSTIAAMLFCVP